MADKSEDYSIIGKIISGYGVKGWVKVKSFTEPETNFLDYAQLFIAKGNSWQPLSIEKAKVHGKGLVAKIEGIDDLSAAEKLFKSELAVKTADLPILAADDFYWHQLQGLTVFIDSDQGPVLGQISHLLETGSNDVLVVKPCSNSIDKRERLLPYRPEVVLAVDLNQQSMWVDWDSEF